MKYKPDIYYRRDFDSRVWIRIGFGNCCYFSLNGFCERFDGNNWVKDFDIVKLAKEENKN